MTKIAIIIPSRLKALRLPNKPLKLINQKEIILHVYDLALRSNVGDVIVATPDQKIVDLLKSKGGKAVLTSMSHETGTDRVFEVFEKYLKKETEIIINLQGDMPNLNPTAIEKLLEHMRKKTCDIGTLASDFENKKEKDDTNVCKVICDKDIKEHSFSRALDFYRNLENESNFTYHHIGIYAFTNKALIRYVGLKRSKLEISRNLEQLRALENDMKIDVGYVDACPLSVDTENDLIKIKENMENK
jgi:3-deoxy-manno-octulosonate cytidylyltransferase (CMP-KDO synthetase)